MAGETTLLDVSFDNVAAVNVQPYQVVVVDASNSTNITTAAKLPAATAGLVPLGVAYDKAKLDSTGTPVASSGINVRLNGIARVAADGAVTAGAFVGTSGTTAGQVTPVTKATAGAQPKAVLGMALTSATNAGDRILVLLTPGGMF